MLASGRTSDHYVNCKPVSLSGEGLALLRGLDGALAVAMSGSGPSLFALFEDLAAASAALATLAAPLEAAGFESWCCRCTGSGATLDPAAAPL